MAEAKARVKRSGRESIFKSGSSKIMSKNANLRSLEWNIKWGDFFSHLAPKWTEHLRPSKYVLDMRERPNNFTEQKPQIHRPLESPLNQSDLSTMET